MTSSQPAQRFCPICNRSFEAGEAVLRCEGCGVMHHPACWVKNSGCATPAPHRVTPVAMAYEGNRPAAPEAPHPGEGTQATSSVPSADEPIPFEPRPTVGGHEPVIGSGAPYRPTPPKRYVPPTERQSPMKPMPKVYNRHRLLAYWYVPAAVVVAILVALAVIWVVEQVGGSGGGGADVSVAPPAAKTASATAVPSASPGTTAVASGTAAAPALAGKFKVGDRLVVAGTGDCLNLRTGPARTNEATACLADGVEVVIVDGPATGDQLTWWKVRSPQGDGWVAEDYLAKKP